MKHAPRCGNSTPGWLLFCVVLAGCVNDTAPKSTDYTATVAGNYQVVADCAYLKIRAEFPDWKKVDLPSMKTVQMVWGPGTHVGGKIDFIAAGDNVTSVRSYMGRAIWGADFYQKRYFPLIQACASSSSQASP